MEGNNFQFKLLSLNVRGIRSFEKRECVFNWLLKQNADIFFLQETYSTKEIENQWRKQWRGELFFSHGTSRSKGVLVLVQENLDFKVKSTYTDDSGRFIFLDTLIQDSPFLLANIYAPTKASEQCQFLDEIAFHIADKVCQSEHYIITGGDFNATFEPNLDCSGGRPSIKNCIKNLNDIMLQNDLVDIWRLRNPDKKRFTWNWRGLTLLGKIQIIKSFAIPKILYRLSLVSTNKTFVKEVNQVLYNFVWKGKDKVKRLALINSVENGGLNMPHIESLIDTQRIVCIKKYLGDSPCSWKIILDHYLHKVGGSLLFHCNFEYTKLPLDLPDYYRECLATWTKLTASPVSSMDEIVNQILWNNKFICIGQKSVFNRKLFSLGLHKVGDLFNEIYIKPHTTLQNLNAVDFLFLNGLYDCLPPEWKKVMTNDPPSVLIKINHIWDDVFLYSSNDALLLSELSSKKIYNILVSKISISPSAKKKFEDSYASTEQALDWKRIYSNAFRCAIDTKTREFQYKILNRILPLNDFLFKIGKSNSPLCSFCQSSEENMSHFFFHCPLVANFWQSVKHLLGGYELIEREVILGITDTVENVFLKNHLILLGKQHIFRCKHNNSLPSAISFTKTLKAVFDSERLIAKENNKINLHYDKWKDLLGYLLSF